MSLIQPSFLIGSFIGALGLLCPQLLAQLILEPTIVEERPWEEEEPKLGESGAVSTLRASDWEAAGATSVADALELLGNISNTGFFSNSDTASPQLRGFGEGSALRTLVTLDGLPVSGEDLAIVPWSEQSLGSLGSIRILRGGRSVRYGPQAVAGVIALESDSTTNSVDLQNSLQVAAGSDGYRQLQGRWQQLSQLGKFSFQGEWKEGDGYRENSAFQTQTYNLSWGLPSKDKGIDWTLRLNYSQSDFEDPGALSRQAFLADPRQSLVFDRFFQQERIGLQSRIAKEFTNGITSQLSLQAWRRDRTNQVQELFDESELWGGSGEWTLRLEREIWEVELGVRARVADLDYERFRRADASSLQQVADLSRVTAGAFALVGFDWGTSWKLSGGASWDEYWLSGQGAGRDVFDDRIRQNGSAWEATLEYHFDDSWRAWLRVDRSLRFPVIDEVAFFQGFVSDPPFNLSLQAEEGWGLELGTRWQGDIHRAEVVFFGQQLEDEIFFDALNGVNENLSRNLRYGIETEWSGSLGNWQWAFLQTLQQAEFRSGFDKGRPIPLVPNYLASIRLGWQPIEDLALQISGNYRSNSNDGNDRGIASVIGFEEIPERWIWNARATWEPYENFQLSAQVTNLFDEQHIASAFSGAVFPGAGRQFRLEGRWNF